MEDCQSVQEKMALPRGTKCRWRPGTSNEAQCKGHWQQVKLAGPSLVTQRIFWAGKGMLWTETLQRKSLENSLSPHLCQGLSHLWGSFQAWPQTVGAGSIAGQNRQQPQQAALLGKLGPHTPSQALHSQPGPERVTCCPEERV